VTRVFAMPYYGQCLNVGRVEDSRGSTRLARLAKTLPAINWLQTVGCLELIGKSADLIQHLKLELGECEFNRREIVLELVEASAPRER
jgi:hypothetical protein